MQSKHFSLLYEIADRCTLFMTEGTSGPYAAAMGREEYEAMLRAKDRKHRWAELHALKQRNLLKLREEGNRIVCLLTNDGYATVLKERIIRTKTPLMNGFVCLVTFDVPEDLRDVRLMLRRFLKRAGFTREQKSVWSSPYHVIEPMLELIRLLKCKRWVHIYLAQRSKRPR